MRDRYRVPKGARAGPPFVAGMPIPHDRGAFWFRALLAARRGGCEMGIQKMARSPEKEVTYGSVNKGRGSKLIYVFALSSRFTTKFFVGLN